jgi:wyosine [tRNA(Phe)-imidazoG37] synthetase (radical SAM superfamily)
MARFGADGRTSPAEANPLPCSDASTKQPSTVYGPVPSWRFGRSLGIDPIVETSTCSFNCIYCQLGAIQRVTAERRVFVPTDRVRRDLERVDWAGVDVVTVSGSGEPTLAANLGEIVDAAQTASDRPVHLLTNATLFGDDRVRREVMAFDTISCKLDAPDDALLRRVNRPVEGIALEAIVRGIERLRETYRGRLLLQVMLMPADVGRVREWAPWIRRVAPDEVHINTPRRPYPARWRLESRGDHASGRHDGPKTLLRVLGPEQARQARRELEELTGVRMYSVYGESEKG